MCLLWNTTALSLTGLKCLFLYIFLSLRLFQELEPHPSSRSRYILEDSSPPVDRDDRPPRPPRDRRPEENGDLVSAKPPPATQEKPKSKNVAGPPVYYPPGVELFAKKDEPVNVSTVLSTEVMFVPNTKREQRNGHNTKCSAQLKYGCL